VRYLKLASAAAVLFLTACAASPKADVPVPVDGGAGGSGPSERVFGTIEFYVEPAQVQVPGSVEQGQPFTVTVVTYGNGCIEKGETKVEVEELRAEVRPYDYNTSSGNDCNDELRQHQHTVTLSFGETGTAEVVFFGQKKNADGVSNTMLTRTVEVR